MKKLFITASLLMAASSTTLYASDQGLNQASIVAGTVLALDEVIFVGDKVDATFKDPSNLSDDSNFKKYEANLIRNLVAANCRLKGDLFYDISFERYQIQRSYIECESLSFDLSGVLVDMKDAIKGISKDNQDRSSYFLLTRKATVTN